MNKELEKELVEIRFHGRGGQGAKTAAQVLAGAALNQDKYIQAFPQYGPERRGAAVTTFTRISNKPINIHSQIHNPNYSVVLDSTLLRNVNVTQGLQKNGVLLINSKIQPDEISEKLGFQGTVITVNASEIASFFINRNIPNLVMVGALNKLTAIVDFEDLATVVEKTFSNKWGKILTEKNILAMKTGSDAVA